MISLARAFVPVFVDTLADHETTRRFGERYGSYPVIRVQDHREHDLAERIDGNPVAGRVPADQLLATLEAARRAFAAGRR